MEGEDAAEQIEVFGVHRLALAPATRSGYVGVRPTKSKRRAWQAWVHIKGEKRRCLGSFNTPQEAAVARAGALTLGPDTLPSPRKQAARHSGATVCGPHTQSLCSLTNSDPHCSALDSRYMQFSSNRQASRPRPSRSRARTRTYTFNVLLLMAPVCRMLSQPRQPHGRTQPRLLLHALCRRPGRCCQGSPCPRVWQLSPWLCPSAVSDAEGRCAAHRPRGKARAHSRW